MDSWGRVSRVNGRWRLGTGLLADGDMLVLSDYGGREWLATFANYNGLPQAIDQRGQWHRLDRGMVCRHAPPPAEAA